jgi:murein DD-endopeptidase MepM/ murein hydrolase activator NlpD
MAERRAGNTMVAEPEAEQPARGRARTERTGGSAFVVVVLTLAVALAAWAPWRADGGATISTYSPRDEAGAALASPAATVALATPVAAASPAATRAATPAAPAASKPEGVPLRRTDWLIVRDYVAHGGPGPNGAIDIGLLGNRDAIGAPVYATHDGAVRVLRNNRIYGNLVAVKNGRWSTTYGYLDRVLVTEGQTVRKGDQIGTLGQSGQATSPRLNYQVWERMESEEVNRNPMDFLSQR